MYSLENLRNMDLDFCWMFLLDWRRKARYPFLYIWVFLKGSFSQKVHYQLWVTPNIVDLENCYFTVSWNYKFFGMVFSLCWMQWFFTKDCVVNSLLLQCQFRFDSECNLSLPDNHKRVSESSQSPQQTCMLDHALLSVSLLVIFSLNFWFYFHMKYYVKALLYW
jgi:hypothetical protein